MANRNVILLDLDNPNVVVKPIDNGEKIQCYHIQAWLNFDEFQDAEAVTAADLKEAFTKGYVPQRK